MEPHISYFSLVSSPILQIPLSYSHMTNIYSGTKETREERQVSLKGTQMRMKERAAE